MFYYFKSVFTPPITIPSVELRMIQVMVNLITSFAIDGTPTANGVTWDPVKKTDTIPKVLNIENDSLTMIPFPDYGNIKVFNDIYANASVPIV
jgi:hypothetical protein